MFVGSNPTPTTTLKPNDLQKSLGFFFCPNSGRPNLPFWRMCAHLYKICLSAKFAPQMPLRFLVNLGDTPWCALNAFEKEYPFE